LDSVSHLPSGTGEIQASSVSEDRLERLTEVCVDDVICAFGLGGLRYGHALVESISRIPSRRLARQILT
jgi:hypothetical protein